MTDSVAIASAAVELLDPSNRENFELPCQFTEIERTARRALVYFQGQSDPDVSGEERSSSSELEVSGMKGR